MDKQRFNVEDIRRIREEDPFAMKISGASFWSLETLTYFVLRCKAKPFSFWLIFAVDCAILIFIVFAELSTVIALTEKNA